MSLSAFSIRHFGPNTAEQQAMLATLGLSTLDELIAETVPSSLRCDRLQAIGNGSDEANTLAKLKTYADQNILANAFIGQGYYPCHTPAVILRNVFENPGWYTAYTPYQPEISQGRLEALLNYQTMICELTGMAVANASLLDEGTAAAEAMALCRRVTKSKNQGFFVDQNTHPQTLAVMQTRAAAASIPLTVGDFETVDLTGDFYGLLVSYPHSDGKITDLRARISEAQQNKVMVVVATDLLALTLLTPPGDWGADIVLGTSQRFGIPLGFGGPHAAFFAVKDEYKRAIPGRLIGVSVDAQGQPAYRLTLQTREQHIRREKATSNICTAQVLLAVMSGLYALHHGATGLTAIATRVHRLAQQTAMALQKVGYRLKHVHFFDTIAVETGDQTNHVLQRALENQLLLRKIDDQTVGISFDETKTVEDVKALLAIFGVESDNFGATELILTQPFSWDPALQRQGPCLRHPIFDQYRSETEMMRYLRRLMDKDFALDRAMIPLGSCTMKLNAAAEMLPVSWPKFSQLHPFAPTEHFVGYQRVIRELEDWLAKMTGFTACSLQPNSGAMGEYAGLLAIRSYHRQRGERQREVCLIPSSAHGTNPASAQMCGFQVVVVNCDRQGNVDVVDLQAKAEKHRDRLAALMLTYPSTHGVFEDEVSKLCEIAHQNGGLVYMDGANLNALVGLVKPGDIGFDACHINLHKTFCIPHGGGGPGVGPIAVNEKLAPFLPSLNGATWRASDLAHSSHHSQDTELVGPVAAAPFGSASILPISWMYMALMGDAGLTRASELAILNANYLATRLSPHYPILYRGARGRIAHECILDLRPLKETVGITVDDVAKRLMDYGFHAPTMSWPVAGTLMIEPTESESKAEIDRFIEAMIAIREEIRAIEQGVWSQADNPLVNAPHPATVLLADDWTHPYSRQQAAYPLKWVATRKVWPSVARIDNTYGDKNIVCSCPAMSEYETE